MPLIRPKKEVLFSVVFILFISVSKAQIVDNVKILYPYFGIVQGALIDTVKVTRVSHDTTWFNATNPLTSGSYYRAGDKVYKIYPGNDKLLFDYRLKAGDTFVLISFDLTEVFTVDSVYLKKMGSQMRKAWLLSNKTVSGVGKMEWVEGLGELHKGWDILRYSFTEIGWQVKGMCLNDTLLYWDTSNFFINWYSPPLGSWNPSPSCNFDSIGQILSIKTITDVGFSIYPNPANNELNLFSESPYTLSIMDCGGRCCIPPMPMQNGSQSVDISELQTGIYILTLKFGESYIFKRLSVIKH